jgi:hypothetical protein
MLFDYLNRVGSRTVRPDRAIYEIWSFNCVSLCKSLEAFSLLDIVRGVRCTVLPPALMLEARESPAVRVREAFKRTLFGG